MLLFFLVYACVAFNRARSHMAHDLARHCEFIGIYFPFFMNNLFEALNRSFTMFGYNIWDIPEVIRYKLLKLRIKFINDCGKDEYGFGWRWMSIYLTPKKKVIEVGGFTQHQKDNYEIIPIFDQYLIYPKKKQK